MAPTNNEAEEGVSSGAASKGSSNSGSGKEDEDDAIPPTSLPRLYSVDQEIGGPPPALKVRLMREKHVHYLINGALWKIDKHWLKWKVDK
jgi:hypothetical protein